MRSAYSRIHLITFTTPPINRIAKHPTRHSTVSFPSRHASVSGSSPNLTIRVTPRFCCPQAQVEVLLIRRAKMT